MNKTNEDRLHDINEKIAIQYQTIEKAKQTIKELKKFREKIEKKIEEKKIKELTVYLKKQGITSIDELENLFSSDLSETNGENEE